MRKVLVVGAHGQTGREVVKQLKQHEYFTPIAGIRDVTQAKEFEVDGIKTRLIDVRQSVAELKQQFGGIDALVITIGGGWMVDLDGKVKLYQVAEQTGVKRVVLVSAGAIQHFHDDKKLPWMDKWEEYSAAMYYADKLLLDSTLDYTIVRPENLTNATQTGTVTLGEYLPHTYTSRANVAAVIVAALEDDRTIYQAFDVEDGTTPIKEALATFGKR